MTTGRINQVTTVFFTGARFASNPTPPRGGGGRERWAPARPLPSPPCDGRGEWPGSVKTTAKQRSALQTLTKKQCRAKRWKRGKTRHQRRLQGWTDDMRCHRDATDKIIHTRRNGNDATPLTENTGRPRYRRITPNGATHQGRRTRQLCGATATGGARGTHGEPNGTPTQQTAQTCQYRSCRAHSSCCDCSPS